MATMVTYNCPCCASAIAFDASQQALRCNSCGNEFEPDALRSYGEAEAEGKEDTVDWEAASEQERAREALSAGEGGLVSYSCDSCAGEIVAQPVAGSFTCPYCGSNVVSQKHFSGMAKPDLVMPFKLDKSAAKAAFAKYLRLKPLLPGVFKQHHKVDSAQGVYVPFWLFDCEARARMRYRATRVKSWSDSRYRYTRTDHYLVRRGGHLRFDQVPVDASARIDDAMMEAIEPFDYSSQAPFNLAYLAGYGAERYDVSVSDSKERANKRIRQSTAQLFRGTVTGYSSVIQDSATINLRPLDIRYALMPVWLLSATHNGKAFTFAMNGQTGKFIGNLPVSKGRFAALAGAVAAVAMAACLLLLYFI